MAAVMIAKVSWNIMKTDSGMVPTREAEVKGAASVTRTCK